MNEATNCFQEYTILCFIMSFSFVMEHLYHNFLHMHIEKSIFVSAIMDGLKRSVLQDLGKSWEIN